MKERALAVLAIVATTVVCGCSGDDDDGGSTATVILSGEEAWGVASDGTALFWTSNADPVSTIRRADLDGAGATTLCTFAQYDAAEPLVVDATDVYALAGGGAANVYRVAKSDTSGAACTPLLDPAAYRVSLSWWITQTASRVYFALAPAADAQATVFGFIEKSTGAATELATVAERVAGGFAVDASYLYFSAGPFLEEKLYRLPLTPGSTPTVVLDGAFLDMVVDGTLLYGDGGVVDLATGMRASLPWTYSPSPPIGFVVSDLVVAGGELFLLHGGATPTGVWRGPKAGGTFTRLCEAGTFPGRLAVDATAAYFSDIDDGAIRRCPR